MNNIYAKKIHDQVSIVKQAQRDRVKVREHNVTVLCQELQYENGTNNNTIN